MNASGGPGRTESFELFVEAPNDLNVTVNGSHVCDCLHWIVRGRQKSSKSQHDGYHRCESQSHHRKSCSKLLPFPEKHKNKNLTRQQRDDEQQSLVLRPSHKSCR